MSGRRRWGAGFLAAAALALTGCPAPPPKTVAVHGQVVFAGGAPVPNANVQFIPAKSGPNEPPIASATTNPKGEFDLKTFLTQTQTEVDGAVPGDYTVTVTGYRGVVNVPVKYATPGATPLKVSVPEAGKSDLVLQLDAS